jgi:hypothetical protein
LDTFGTLLGALLGPFCPEISVLAKNALFKGGSQGVLGRSSRKGSPKVTKSVKKPVFGTSGPHFWDLFGQIYTIKSDIWSNLLRKVVFFWSKGHFWTLLDTPEAVFHVDIGPFWGF